MNNTIYIESSLTVFSHKLLLFILLIISLQVFSEDKNIDSEFLMNRVSNFSISLVSDSSSATIPKTTAKSWIVVDVNSEQIIGSSNPDIQLEPASLTKIMTAYIIFNELNEKRLDLNQKIQISNMAWRTGGSRMFIEPKHSVTVHELIQGMIVQSGNDASVALAEAVGGDEDSFVAIMNREARVLGMDNTDFTNSTGLSNPKHKTTARDLAKLSVSLIKKHNQFFHYYKQKSFTYNNISQFNRNRLLWTDPTIDGMKTGHTDSAGYCLISTAMRGGQRILVVILGADSEGTRTQESLKLLNWSFQNFETTMLVEQNKRMLDARVWEGKSKKIGVGPDKSLWLAVPRGRYKDVKYSITLIDPIFAPLKKGQLIGTVKIILDEKVLRSDSLVALEEIERSGFMQRLLDSTIRFFNQLSCFKKLDCILNC